MSGLLVSSMCELGGTTTFLKDIFGAFWAFTDRTAIGLDSKSMFFIRQTIYILGNTLLKASMYNAL